MVTAAKATNIAIASNGADEALTIPAPIGTPAVLFREGSTAGEEFRQNLITSGVIEAPGK